jgi:hypothetical protein
MYKGAGNAVSIVTREQAQRLWDHFWLHTKVTGFPNTQNIQTSSIDHQASNSMINSGSFLWANVASVWRWQLDSN